MQCASNVRSMRGCAGGAASAQREALRVLACARCAVPEALTPQIDLMRVHGHYACAIYADV